MTDAEGPYVDMLSASRLTEFSRIKWEHATQLKKRGAFAEAERELKEALGDQPDHPLLRASLADLYQRQGRMHEARMLAESILLEDPENPRACYVLGRIYLSEEKTEEAIECFQRASLRDPSPYLIVQTARALKKLGRLQEAMAVLESAPARARQDLHLLKEKALLLARMDRKEEALSLYEKIHEQTPEDEFVRTQIYNLRGAGRPPEEVIEELRKIVRLPSRSGDPQLHGLLAQRLKEAGREREAAEEYQTAWRLSDGHLFFLKQEGFCRHRAGDHEQALEALRHAFIKDPGDVRVKSTIEKIYRNAGRLEDYAALLESILADQPHHVKLVGVLKKVMRQIAHTEK